MDTSSLYNASDNVQILDDTHFIGKDYKIKSAVFHGPGVLKIYAPWCGHCQSKVKCLNMLSGFVKKHGMQVYVIDGTDNELFSSKFPTDGYPTFLEVTAKGHIGKSLKDEHGQQVYTVPAIVASLCGNNPEICQYAKSIDDCTAN